MKTICIQCKMELFRKKSRVLRHKNHFCSTICKGEFQKNKPPWNKGLHGIYVHTEEHKRKIGLGVKKSEAWRNALPRVIANLRSPEIRKKACDNRPRLIGEKNGMYGRSKELNPNWKGGVSYWRKEYYSSIPYKEWRKSVLRRDNYVCQMCLNKKKGNTKLHCHHRKGFALFPDLRLVISNGVTLCQNCHNFVHSNEMVKDW
jgi:hypothetical protein